MRHIGIASIKERQEQLFKTLDSLLPQADIIHLYLNNYQYIPARLKKEKKITVYNKPAGDITDNGKFYGLLSIDVSSSITPDSVYYITADDDIIYPENFVSVLVESIDKYKKQAVCAYGGRALNSLPAMSYYNDKHNKISIFKSNPDAMVVHTGLGAGLGFHVGTLNFDPVAWVERKMSDINLAKEAYSKNVPIVAIPHAGNFQYQQVENTIFDEFKNNDTKQTSLFNSIDFSLDKDKLCPELCALLPTETYKRGQIYVFKDLRGRKVSYKFDKYTKILLDTKQILPL